MKSFSCGSRWDLLLKFLDIESFPDGDAAEFFRGLLERLGDAFDTGDWDAVMDHAQEWQVRGRAPSEQVAGARAAFAYDTTPWTPLPKPLSAGRVTLISAGGLFVEGDEPMAPQGPTQDEAIPRIGEFLRAPPVLSTCWAEPDGD